MCVGSSTCNDDMQAEFLNANIRKSKSRAISKQHLNGIWVIDGNLQASSVLADSLRVRPHAAENAQPRFTKACSFPRKVRAELLKTHDASHTRVRMTIKGVGKLFERQKESR